MLSMHEAMAPRIIGHRLEELLILGEGGQGSVSLCKDRVTGALFAVKTALSPSGEEDLQNEFNTVRLLMDSGVHGIVAAHNFDVDDLGRLCLRMDLCNRGSLLSLLQRRRGNRLREPEAAAMVRSLAATLLQCHSLGIMHRDIKLENVLVHCSAGSSHSKKRPRTEITALPDDAGRSQSQSQEGTDHHHHLDDGCCTFLLSDFGIACMFRSGHHIRDGSLAGTTEYMAPEMLKGAYDERADVWSLGVLLHIILTGTFPPQSSEMVRLVEEGCNNATHHDRQKHPWKMNWSKPIYSHLSEGAKSVLAGMLHKKPRHRLSLSDICHHPWVVPQEEAHPTTTTTPTSAVAAAAADVPATKRIRLVHGLFPIAENHHHHDKAAAAAVELPQPTHAQHEPAKPMDAPPLIRIKFGGVIIRELQGDCNKEHRKQLLPNPLPVLPAC